MSKVAVVTGGARGIGRGCALELEAELRRLKLIQDAVAGDMKVPQKAYLWALRNANLTAAVSEMTNQQLVDDNLPLAGKTPVPNSK